MIGFALPWILGVAVAGVLAIAALHLLSVRRPPELLLPTARFLPERDVRAVSRTRKPSDVLLLVLRIGALVAAGLAAALPTFSSRARERVVMIVADRGVVRDTVAMRSLVQESAGQSRVVFVGEPDSSAGVAEPGALLPIAWRAASELSQRNTSVDSIDLHLLLSSAPVGDIGLAAWRSAWPGRVTTHAAPAEALSRRVLVVDGNTSRLTNEKSASGAAASQDDDAVIAAMNWHATRDSRLAAVQIDTVVLFREGAGNSSSGVAVVWPANGTPATWRASSKGDSAAALTVGGRALVGPFPVIAIPDSIVPADARFTPIAWWSDGRIAATERRTASGCERTVAVVSDPASDILLSTSANALFDRLLAPCETVVPVAAATLTVTDVKQGALADASVFRGDAGTRASRSSWIVPTLFALSLLLLVAEWRLRTREVAAA